MKKRFIQALIVIGICTNLVGCNSNYAMYAKAKAAIESTDYAKGLEMLSLVRGYRDSDELLLNTLNEYVNERISKEYYDEAVEIATLYEEYTGVDEVLNRVKEEQRKYVQYRMAENSFEYGKFENGFEVLTNLPKDFRNVQEMYDTYNKLRDNKLLGIHYHGSTGEISMELTFKIVYSREEEKFKLYINKETYYTDGITKAFESEYYLDAENIEKDDYIKIDKYTWRMGENGRVVETDNGHTLTYR